MKSILFNTEMVKAILDGRKNNLEPSKISLVCKNKRKTTGGFKWKYL